MQETYKFIGLALHADWSFNLSFDILKNLTLIWGFVARCILEIEILSFNHLSIQLSDFQSSPVEWSSTMEQLGRHRQDHVSAEVIEGEELAMPKNNS